MNTTCVIIGAGQAGGRAALALRDNGFEGEIHIIGKEPSPPYNRPPLSKAVLLGKKPVEKTHLTAAENYAEKDISLHLDCSATSVDPRSQSVTCSNGETFTYTQLILATGSYPRQLNIPGSQLNGVTTFRTDTDSVQLAAALQPGSNLVIVGGGFIGLEIAASARELECNVTVLEAQDRLMSRSMPENAAKDVASVHHSYGVEILTGVTIDAFEGSEHVEAVRFADGSSIKADNVVIGIGIIADIELAQQAELTTDNGIVCDEFTRTSIDNIFAIGDCANTYLPRYGQHIRLESSQNADLQAAVAAKTIVGDMQAYDPVPWLWSQQYKWIIQTAGFTQDADEIISRGSVEDELVLYFALKDQKLHGVVGIGKGAAIAKEVRLAQMLIEKNASVDAASLANPDISLKNLLSS